MTLSKWKIGRSAVDPQHRKLMLEYRNARGGEKLKALAKLKAYVLGRLQEARQG